MAAPASAVGIIANPLYQAFANSFLMIFANEIGDKTFFIALVMACTHDRRFVYVGAAGALAAMTLLSAGIGLVVPALLAPEYTQWVANLLFVYFGLRLLYEAYRMFSNGEGAGPSDELEEVEKELEDKNGKLGKSTVAQAFMLTFTSEWGDRSQIATIALAAEGSAIGVTLGGIVGHACCTALAVLGGRMLVTRLSERFVAVFGGVLFLAFAGHGLIAALT
jgi:putative Ca2+/H+ antiporter (TMEM165/GDT1 family)